MVNFQPAAGISPLAEAFYLKKTPKKGACGAKMARILQNLDLAVIVAFRCFGISARQLLGNFAHLRICHLAVIEGDSY